MVPSKTLKDIARLIWKQPSDKIERIANGIDVAAYAKPRNDDAIPKFERREGEVIIGTLAGLRAVKNIPRLVRVVAACGPNVRLVVVGEGPERENIRLEAEKLGIVDRLVMPGFMKDPHQFIGLFDIFALSSDSEQFPISVVEAMAAGLPVISTDVGDVRNMLPLRNADFITRVHDEAALVQSLRTLIQDADLRSVIGSENRIFAETNYQESDMLSRYSVLYGKAMNRHNFGC